MDHLSTLLSNQSLFTDHLSNQSLLKIENVAFPTKAIPGNSFSNGGNGMYGIPTTPVNPIQSNQRSRESQYGEK